MPTRFAHRNPADNAKAWALWSAIPAAHQVATAAVGGPVVLKLKSTILPADRVMGWDDDSSAANKGVWEVPVVAPSYAQIAAWDLGSANEINHAEYYDLGGSGNYAAVIILNPNTGSSEEGPGNSSSTFYAAGNYRIKFTGHATSPDIVLVGNLTRVWQDVNGRVHIRIGTGTSQEVINYMRQQITDGNIGQGGSGALVTPSGYSQITLERRDPAPAPITYTQVFDFPAGGNTNTTQNVADYIGQLAAYRNALCVNNAHDSLLNTVGTYRLRRASGTSAETTGVIGNLYKRTAPYGGSGYVCFRIGSSESTAEAEMGAAFGTGSNITTGANWILERQQ